MDFSQLKKGEIAAALGGIVLAIAVFLPAYSPSDNPNARVAGGKVDASIFDTNTISRILLLPDMQERLRELGAAPAKTTPDEFLAFVREDNAKWAKLIKEKGIVVEGGK